MLGQKIREARKAKGIKSQEKLARLAGVHKNTIARIEVGEAKGASFKTLRTLARVLGVDLNWLLSEPAKRKNRAA